MRNPVGLFSFRGVYVSVSKQILTIGQQVQSYVNAGMKITSREEVEEWH